jgi:hypothetical protein
MYYRHVYEKVINDPDSLLYFMYYIELLNTFSDELKEEILQGRTLPVFPKPYPFEIPVLQEKTVTAQYSNLGLSYVYNKS